MTEANGSRPLLSEVSGLKRQIDVLRGRLNQLAEESGSGRVVVIQDGKIADFPNRLRSLVELLGAQEEGGFNSTYSAQKEPNGNLDESLRIWFDKTSPHPSAIGGVSFRLNPQGQWEVGLSPDDYMRYPTTVPQFIYKRVNDAWDFVGNEERRVGVVLEAYQLIFAKLNADIRDRN